MRHVMQHVRRILLVPRALSQLRRMGGQTVLDEIFGPVVRVVRREVRRQPGPYVDVYIHSLGSVRVAVLPEVIQGRCISA